MNRTVTITLDIEPDNYEQGDDTDQGAIDLAIAMILNDADWPDTITVACGNALRTTDTVFLDDDEDA